MFSTDDLAVDLSAPQRKLTAQRKRLWRELQRRSGNGPDIAEAIASIDEEISRRENEVTMDVIVAGCDTETDRGTLALIKGVTAPKLQFAGDVDDEDNEDGASAAGVEFDREHARINAEERADQNLAIGGPYVTFFELDFEPAQWRRFVKATEYVDA